MINGNEAECNVKESDLWRKRCSQSKWLEVKIVQDYVWPDSRFAVDGF